MVLTFVINESIIHSIVNNNLYGERKDIMCKIYDSGRIGYPVYTVTRSGANLCISSELHGQALKYEIADIDGALIKTIADDIQQVNQWLNPTELEDLLGKYGFDSDDITLYFI